MKDEDLITTAEMRSDLTYEPTAGMSITHACREAVAMAVDSSRPVRFRFNDIALRALPTDQPETIEARWRTLFSAEQEAYRNSPEGKAAKAQREATIIRRQTETDAAIAALPKILRTDNHLNALMNWLREFVESSDDIGVRCDRNAVADQLILAGYFENEYVGRRPEWFNTRERMGRYIVGQVISAIDQGMPPHPVTLSFVEKYFALPSASLKERKRND